MEILDYVRLYLKQKWAVIPVHSINIKGICTCQKGEDCSSPGKHPRISWKNQQIPTEKQVEEWWARWPSANVGIITGEVSGIIVLDIDGIEGMETLEKENLQPGYTVTTKTGGGGYHFFYRHPGFKCCNFARKIGRTILPSVDFKGDGGLIVAPPSLHKSGRHYEWSITISDQEMLDPPEWLLDLIKQQHVDNDGNRPEYWRYLTENLIKEGSRNTTLAKLTGHLLRRYVYPKVTLNLILSFNQTHCAPPLAKEEVVTIVNSIAKKESERRGGNVS